MKMKKKGYAMGGMKKKGYKAGGKMPKKKMGGAPAVSPTPKLRPRGLGATKKEMDTMDRGFRINAMEGREREEMKGMKAGGMTKKGKAAGGMMKKKGFKAGGMTKKGKAAGGMMKKKGFKAGGMTKKGKAKGGKIGGKSKVRGAGIAQRGVRPAKMR